MVGRNGTGTADDAATRPPETAACRVDGLTKTYRAGFWGRRRPAVSGLGFAVARGEICGLLGHNGAGKTTTLKAILDLVRPDAGRIEIFGVDHRQRRARARVGYLPEGPYFYDHLTAAELLDFYGRLADLPARERARRAREALALVGMEAHAGLALRRCSKGMLQRVGLAQALLADPELLILDEPMSGLDPLGRREVRDLLGELRARGKTILLSSHIVPDLEALADRVVILARGRLAGTHDLRDDCATRFEVEVARRPAARAAVELWSGADGRAVAGGARRGAGGGELLVAPDLPRLRLLLELCAQEGIPVHTVASRRTGLEELFLRSVGAGREPGAAGVPAPAAAPASAETAASVLPPAVPTPALPAAAASARAPQGEPSGEDEAAAAAAALVQAARAAAAAPEGEELVAAGARGAGEAAR